MRCPQVELDRAKTRYHRPATTLKVSPSNTDKASSSHFINRYHHRQRMGLFSDVAYNLSSSFSIDDQKLLSASLDEMGATQSPLEEATHIIADTLEFEGWWRAPKKAEVVTVSRCKPLEPLNHLF